MIYVVCGLIGAGKTTFAKQNFRAVTDLDDFPQGSTKTDQIRETFTLARSGIDVAHITCYPTDEELRAFKHKPVKYILVDTPQAVAMQRILIRGRKRDLVDLGRVQRKNVELDMKYALSNIDFLRVR